MKVPGAAALAMVLGLTSLAVLGMQTSLIDFSLEDHDRTNHAPRQWNGTGIVLFLADNKGSEYNRNYAWTLPLAAHFKAQASAGEPVLASVADLRGTPRLARGFMRGMFKPQAQDPVGLTLLDWNGQLFTAYGLAPATFHMLVFDENHSLVYQTAMREFNARQLASILEALTSTGTR